MGEQRGNLRPWRRAARAVCTALAVIVMAGCSAAGTSTTETISFTVVGDSITAGTQPLEGRSVPGRRSWLSAVGGDPLEFQGGWAVPGATSADMRAAVGPVPADVLVLMAGTNDLHRFTWEVTAANLRAVVGTVGADRVVLAAIPPYDGRPALAVAFNMRLRGLAAEQGWEWFDPWEGVSRDGRFAPGASNDGVHPTTEVAQVVGERFRTELLALH